MSARKPARPALPSGRDAIVVPGLPAASAETPIPAPYPGVRGYGQVQDRKTARRGDPPGMTRASYYISRDAAEALDQAVHRVLAALGGDVPKHVVLSALLEAGAAQAHRVTARLAERRAAELEQRLDALRAASETD